MRAIAVALMWAGSIFGQPVAIGTLASPSPAGWFLIAKTGKIAAAVCRDDKLRVWALPDGRITRTIDVAKREFDAVVISDAGDWIAAGDHSGSYTVWNVSSGGVPMQLKMPYYPSAMAFSADGKRLAIGPVGEPVQIYEVASGKRLFELQRTVGGSAGIAFSRDGGRIATADADTVVRIYDGRNGELLTRHTDFLLEPLAASFSSDGKQLLAAGADKFIAVLDAKTGAVVRKSGKLVDPVAYLEVSPDGVHTAAGLMHADNLTMPGLVLVSETVSGRQVQEWMPGSRVLGGGWTSDGRLLVGIGSAKGVEIWRVR